MHTVEIQLQLHLDSESKMPNLRWTWNYAVASIYQQNLVEGVQNLFRSMLMTKAN